MALPGACCNCASQRDISRFGCPCVKAHWERESPTTCLIISGWLGWAGSSASTAWTGASNEGSWLPKPG